MATISPINGLVYITEYHCNVKLEQIQLVIFKSLSIEAFNSSLELASMRILKSYPKVAEKH